MTGHVYKGPGSLQVPFGGGLLYCLVFLLAVVGLSSLTYRFVEVPARNALNARFKHQRVVNAVDTVFISG